MSDELTENEKFASGIPVAAFRYQVRVNGQVEFVLIGSDGTHNYFLTDPTGADALTLSMMALAKAAHQSKSGHPQSIPTFEFPTTLVSTLIPKGGNSEGHIQFTFFTSLDVRFSTMLRPELAGEMFASLGAVLSGMANPPDVYRSVIAGPKLKGKAHKGDNVAVHFGQTYNRKMLEILGVLVVRANLLEDSLLRMLVALLEAPTVRVEALFYSTQNMRARLDMIQAIANKADLPVGLHTLAGELLEDVKSVSDQRNQLIHGEWEFKSDKFTVRTRRSLDRSTKQEPIASYKSLEALVTKYHDLSVGIAMFVNSLATSRNIAKKTA